MDKQILLNNIQSIWHQLYKNQHDDSLEGFLSEMELNRQTYNLSPQPEEWYKDAIIYSVYVDLFNQNFSGLTNKLDYLADLGVNCIWLLPILDSPMKDAGFDISDYYQIRAELLGLPPDASKEEKLSVFRNFLLEAEKREIRVIFDIAMNHTSDQIFWFTEASKSEDNPYRDFFIWSKDDQKYNKARLLFKGMVPSNWEKHGDSFYFHRFFEFQPDLNYRNPKVLIEMARVLMFWLSQGVNGFRADAIPYLWKEENTDCENLPETHLIVKFYRAVLDYIRPNSLLLAEACQKPFEVVKYFGNGDECNAGYHFPLMPQMFKAIAAKSSQPILNTLSKAVTPPIPENAQWFTFLRCHDELSLELVYVTEEDRAYIHNSYCHQPEWDFRVGEGISARLAELMLKDERKIALAFSIMLSLPGSPVIYYGDEFAKLNDMDYYLEQTKMTGKDDTRFLVRGRIDWSWLEQQLHDHQSLSFRVFSKVSEMLKIRKNFKCFGRGIVEWISAVTSDQKPNEHILAYYRKYQDETVICIHNLSDEVQELSLDLLVTSENLFKDAFTADKNKAILEPYEYQWIKI